jgi:small neutral amino acid transporter SnatA (MarC family)
LPALASFIKSFTLLLMLLNPFLMIVYLMDLVQDLEPRTFNRVLIRAGLISSGIFIVFALLGETIFSTLLQARFESFQIFGGIVFLIIGVRFVFSGTEAMKGLRGRPEHIAGAIAMPIMIGPATISASILAGNSLGRGMAILAILLAVGFSVLVVIGLKRVHDYVRPRNEGLVERYIEIMGRVTALVVGTFAVEMIMQGLRSWLKLMN